MPYLYENKLGLSTQKKALKTLWPNCKSGFFNRLSTLPQGSPLPSGAGLSLEVYLLIVLGETIYDRKLSANRKKKSSKAHFRACLRNNEHIFVNVERKLYTRC
jgi:hypothetical protein